MISGQYSTLGSTFGLEDLSHIFNVKDYGAMGDDATNDTVAILKAYAAIPSTGGTLYFPVGTYQVDGADNGGLMIVKSNIAVIFEKGAILKLAASPTVNQGPVIQVANYNDSSVRGTVENIFINGITVDGNKANQKNGSGASDGVNSGINIEDAINVTVMNFEVYDCDGYGVGNVGSHLPHRGHILFQNGMIHDNYYDGVDFKAGIHGFTMRDIYSYNNGYDGAIAGRDGMGFDLRGSDGLIDNCVAGRTPDGDSAPNHSGNFRIRENAGRFVSIQNSHSYNAPSGTYGYNLIGANTGVYNLFNCSSYEDDTGFRLRIGHYKLWGCSAQYATNYGVHLEDDGNGSVIAATTTTMVVPQTKQVIDISVAAATNFSAGMYLRFSDGTNLVEGVVKSISGNVMTVDIKSNQGASSVASGASVTERNFGSLVLNGCNLSYNGIDGIVALSTPYHVSIVNSDILRNVRYGIRMDANNLTTRDSRIQNNARGFFFSTMTSNRVFIENNDINDDQTDKTQTYAFEWSGASNTSCTGNIQWNNTVGNATGVTNGTQPSGITYSNNL